MPRDEPVYDIELVEVEAELTEQMRHNYDRFWQLLIGRVLTEWVDSETPITNKGKKRKKKIKGKDSKTTA